ncbi:MAG: zinc ABC transporter ATP-binding protein ZnuC [Gammaproteobacteria bacterium]|nr:zinc ABC transporter ATP-binding protein ZnuC [Pseudomonadales bacterium]MCP5347786.1 zinc ABC transporter ATP-binding protein ZnuC [Pseudomonadales bacterium]
MQENPASDSTLVKADDISVSFAGRQILHGVSLTIERGRIVTLIGPNGAGKTTLVRVILGMLTADSGEIWKRPGLTIGYMPQRLHVEPTLPISVLRFLQLTGIRDRASILELLEQLKVAHLADQQLRNISGGELQRVLLGRALLRKPSLLILDEPAQGVDVNGQIELYQLIDGIAEQNTCGILMISHDLHLVMSATDEVVCLNQHVCCHGKPEQVSNDPAYLALFGKGGVDTIAVYTHNHNHSHDIHGNVIEESGEKHG